MLQLLDTYNKHMASVNWGMKYSNSSGLGVSWTVSGIGEHEECDRNLWDNNNGKSQTSLEKCR